MSDVFESRRKRIIYRSWHRGCKETDIILGNFCDHFIQEMDDAGLTLFEQLLEEDDAAIWSWLTHKTSPENPAYEPLLEQLRHFRDYAKS